MDRVACPKCGHPVAEHQPSWGYRPVGSGAGNQVVGCSECTCILTMAEKLRAWGGE